MIGEFLKSTLKQMQLSHYSDVIMGAMASQITGVAIVCSTVFSGADLIKHQGSASLTFVREIHWWPVDSPYKSASNAEDISTWWRHHAVCHHKLSCIGSEHTISYKSQWRHDIENTLHITDPLRLNIFCCLNEQPIEQAFDFPVIWNTIYGVDVIYERQ